MILIDVILEKFYSPLPNRGHLIAEKASARGPDQSEALGLPTTLKKENSRHPHVDFHRFSSIPIEHLLDG